MFKAVGKDSLKIYVVEDTKALVFQKLKEKYPDTAINKAVFPETLFVQETKKWLPPASKKSQTKLIDRRIIAWEWKWIQCKELS